jgi:hypothetical protein
MGSPEEVIQGLEALGFTPGNLAPNTPGYVHRTGRVALGVSQAELARCFEPPHQDEANAPWPVFLKLEARWLHAADIFRRTGLAATSATFAQYLTCLARLGLFPDAVNHFYEFDQPDFLDVALSINTQTLAEQLTASVVRERLQPLVEGLVRVELYMVFGAALDVLREELRQRAEMEKIRLPVQH